MRTAALRTLVAGVLLAVAAATAGAAEGNTRAREEQWNRQHPVWRAFHTNDSSPEHLAATKQLVTEVLAPRGFNVLILGIGYSFQFQSHRELGGRGMNREQARELAEVCRKSGVRLIPLFNCLGHQSWARQTGTLLAKHPEFDETPQIGPDNKGIYCREWCPSNPEVDKVVFDLLDELIDAFDADALHVGMDEVFLIGSPQCPRCKGKDVAELYAGAVNRLHRHLVDGRGVEMLMWGDRLINAREQYHQPWEASRTGSHRAVDLIPKDIIVCDWHYRRLNDYPSARYFQQKGFRVLPAAHKNPEAAVALIRCARQDATGRMLGTLFTCWAGDSPSLVAAFNEKAAAPESADKANSRRQAALKVAETVKAGLKELDSRADAER